MLDKIQQAERRLVFALDEAPPKPREKKFKKKKEKKDSRKKNRK
jgi:hypothetical protein